MSDTSTPAPSSSSSAQKKGGGNFLTHKLGPLPMWGWFVVVIGAVLLYKILKGRSSSAASTTASGTVQGANNALGMFGSEGFSTNSAGEVIDNATGDILGTFGGATGSGTGTTTNQGWVNAAQQALFNLGYDNTLVDTALQDYESGQALPQNEYNVIESAIHLVGNPPSGMALPQLQAAPPAAAAAPQPTPSAPAPVVQALADIDAQNWPQLIKFGQDPNAATDFTAIGTVNNGVYSGYNVTHGAPVYAGVFGGYVQDFNMSTLPNGTTIYAPTTLVNQGYLGSHT